MLEEVRRVMEDPASKAKDKRDIQTLCGINYSSTGMGVIWGPTQDIAQVPECMCYDWMHNVCASGGVGAHHVNQLVRVVAQAGVTLTDITAFIQKVVQPTSNRSLRSFKFEQRIADTSSAPIRAFASEVLSLVPALALMCDVVLGGFDPLREHVACFLLLARALDIQTHNNDTLDFLPRLDTLLRQYHKSFCKLYPGGVKPKIHYMLRCCQQLLNVGANVSCFAPERAHKWTKTISGFAFKICVKP